MPYKSKSQAAYFNIHKKELEKKGVNVDEWNASSKGKKLPKKVKKKYGEGGEVEQFYEDYIKSPKYKTRLKKQGYENPNQTIKDRLNALNTTKLTHISGLGSQYLPKNKVVNLDQEEAKKFGLPSQSVLPHELSHVAGSMGIGPWIKNPNLTLNIKEQKLLNSKNQYRNIDTDYTSPLPLDQRMMIDHDKLPSEAKANIDALRYHLFKDKIYNTGTQDFNQDILNKAKKKYGNNKVLNRNFKAFKDTDLIYLMNNIASNDNTQSQDMAKYGKKIKAPDGLQIPGDPFYVKPIGTAQPYNITSGNSPLSKDPWAIPTPLTDKNREANTFRLSQETKNNMANIGLPEIGEDPNWGKIAATTLASISALLPAEQIKNPIVRPKETYNPNQYGTGSQAIFDDGGKVKKSIPNFGLKIQPQRAVAESTAIPKAPTFKGKLKGPSQLPIYNNLKQTKALKDASTIVDDQAFMNGRWKGMKNVDPKYLHVDTTQYLAQRKLLSENANPNIQYDPIDPVKRSHYKAANNTLYLNSANDLISETSHAYQSKIKGSPIGTYARGIKDFIQHPIDREGDYDRPGTVEHEAHTEIEPMLQKRYKTILDSINVRKKNGLPMYDDGGKLPRIVKKEEIGSIYKDYTPVPGMPNHFQKIKQSASASGTTASKSGPKMSNAAWKAHLAKMQEKDIVFFEEDAPQPVPQPVKMNMGERIFDDNKHGIGDLSWTMQQGTSDNPGSQSKVANFQPIDAMGNPTGDYYENIPGTEWSNITGGVNKLTSDKLSLLEPYKRKSTVTRDFGGPVGKGKTLDIHWGGSAKPLTSDIWEFTGNLHEQSDGKGNKGIGIEMNGQRAEVEGGETAHINPLTGETDIMGNLKIPGQKIKFKTASKRLGKEEQKVNKQLDMAIEMIKHEPTNSFDRLSWNTGKLLIEGGSMKKKTLIESKDNLVNLQNALLDTASEFGISASHLSEGRIKKEKAKNGAYEGMKLYRDGGKLPIAKDGKNISPEELDALIEAASKKYGIDSAIVRKLVEAESGGKTNTKSHKGASGVMQLMPRTAKLYGVENKLHSSKPEDVAAVIDAGVKHLKTAINNNKGDIGLGLAEYNMGRGNLLKFAPKDRSSWEALKARLETKRKNNPSKDINLAQNQSYNYVTGILGNKDMKKFNQEFYAPIEVNEDGTPISNPIKATLAAPTINTPVLSQETKDNMKSLQEYHPQKTGGFKNLQRPVPPSNAEALRLEQLLPEIYAAATNKVEPVHLQQYDPELFTPYQVSFQDRINENTATFNSLKDQVAYNPTALSTLAGQKYAADSAVKADEFRTNQDIENEITNKNVSLLNDAELKNLQLADQQYVRQSQAKSITKGTNNAILNSISSKYLQNSLENRQLKAYESMTGMRFDKDGILRNYNGPAHFTENSVEGASPVSNATKTETITYDPITRKPSRKETFEKEKDPFALYPLAPIRPIRNSVKYGHFKEGGNLAKDFNQLFAKKR